MFFLFSISKRKSFSERLSLCLTSKIDSENKKCPIYVGEPILLHGVSFTPIRLLHGRLPIVGYRIDVPGGPSMAYCTDVSSIPPETWPELLGLDILVLDMLRFRHHPTHLTLNQAIEIAEQVDAKQTYFTHMTHCILHKTVNDGLPERMHLAYDGLQLS